MRSPQVFRLSQQLFSTAQILNPQRPRHSYYENSLKPKTVEDTGLNCCGTPLSLFTLPKVVQHFTHYVVISMFDPLAYYIGD